MTDLTLLVRLHESTPIGPPSLSAGGSIPVEPGTVVLLVGAVGAGTIMTGSYSSSASAYVNKVSKQGRAKGDVLRITNPDDRTQHVDVADTNSRDTASGSGPDYQKVKNFYSPGDRPQVDTNGQILRQWSTHTEASHGFEFGL